MPEWLQAAIAYGGLFIAACIILRIISRGGGGNFNNHNAF